MRHFLDLTVHTNALDYLENLDQHALIIYSPTSAKLAKVKMQGNFIDAHSFDKDAQRVEHFCNKNKYEKVVAFGGGTAIDIAKYIASILACDFICIPTMLSTNAFATNKVALMREGRKVTLDAKMPNKIILDTDLIALASALNLYGFCDILSIHTALYDWELADKAGKESIDSNIYMKANRLLEKTVQFSNKLTNPSSDDIGELFSLIGESGHITNIYGSGRPESGSEHIFAKEFERRVNIPHGISIAIGISLMSRIQDNYAKVVEDTLEHTGILSEIRNQPSLCEAVKASLINITPRKDRYTVLDEKALNADQIENMTNALFNIGAKVKHEYSYN